MCIKTIHETCGSPKNNDCKENLSNQLNFQIALYTLCYINNSGDCPISDVIFHKQMANYLLNVVHTNKYQVFNFFINRVLLCSVCFDASCV